ncbi:UDP-3-O-(3-hydroxymyristoyl)glucosamine N-acyltransferase [Pseudoruegeria sp. SK021]|uniref:UDP-3-O-(3-hydroxymyristoyl)glucosamine N-acyltransferase n=1 Tax=Pseudoruegeria sp. SK021 TaxID=1933035 RepID=UPI000A2491F6|nr:UDP-3-O-(3-hydroxymyristoyl)glucosamine N-acyltransferase [Pseudoruegeria sp. SK021]OSP55234.1 UDP-3-O-(3-hydroxymyristoyl)glucosamine N-acyltransferase [Pseudoruegeria sp. SK021]
MTFSLNEIATALGARIEGDGSLRISGASEPASAGAQDLALAMDPKYAARLSEGAARAAILWDGADWKSYGLAAAVFVPRPRYAMAGVTTLLDPGPEIAPGVHPTAYVDPSAVLGEGVAIGPNAVIGARVRLGKGVRIGPLTSVAEDAVLGDAVLLYAGVRVGARVRLGNRVILQPGAVIGADGFSFVTPEKSRVEGVRESLGAEKANLAQSWTRIHSLGTVEIGDDVEIGANSTVDRGTIRATTIGRGTKLDNLVQIGHNVQIGEDCLLCGLVGVAGSTRIGNRVVLAGQCGVNDNIFIGDDVVAGGGTKIFTNAPAGRVLLGYPAVKMATHIESYKALRRLPRLFREVAALQKAVLKGDQTN